MIMSAWLADMSFFGTPLPTPPSSKYGGGLHQATHSGGVFDRRAGGGVDMRAGTRHASGHATVQGRGIPDLDVRM